MNDIEKLSRLVAEYTGCNRSVEIKEIKGSGSSRRYFRVETVPQLIATVGNDVAENEAFIYLTGTFGKLDLRVPELLAVSDDRRVYLQQDCGSKSLFECLERDDLISKALEALVELQFRGGKVVDYNRCYPVAAMDERAIMWDLNYFKYCFLKNTPLEFSEPRLEDDFSRLARDLALKEDAATTFMLRDFQSRNVMVDDDDRVTLIDYQGGRRGPVEYDVASFAWQARAGFSAEKREAIAAEYYDLAKNFMRKSREEYFDRLSDYVFLRRLQTLGAYGYRGLIQQKSHFVKSIPQALKTLEVSERLAATYPYLVEVIREMIPAMLPKFEVADELTVKVGSFSYKQGIPADLTGNGGGYVFDCRGLPNPGRYEQYKHLTGRAPEVIDYLERFSEIEVYINSVKQATGISVKTYIERGFNSLMINFGCTGGQHRSVYCAERIARWINEEYGVKVELNHREQNIKETLESR